MALTRSAFPAFGQHRRLPWSRPPSPPGRPAGYGAELDAFDQACNRFRGDSELTRVNSAAGRVTRVGPLLAAAVAVALRAARQTAGSVDPTVAPALVALGYDRDFAAVAAETADAVRGRPAAGWRTVSLDVGQQLLRLAPGSHLDLGATAKALAADRAAAAIAATTGSPTLVALGGDVATAGPVPVRGWPIHVTDDHRAGPCAPSERVAVRGGGLATSSITVRRWRRAGRIVHHIVDPLRASRPRRSGDGQRRRALRVLAANAASTAAIVRGTVGRVA